MRIDGGDLGKDKKRKNSTIGWWRRVGGMLM